MPIKQIKCICLTILAVFLTFSFILPGSTQPALAGQTPEHVQVEPEASEDKVLHAEPDRRYHLDEQSKFQISVLPRTITQTKENITYFKNRSKEAWSNHTILAQSTTHALEVFSQNKGLAFLGSQLLLFCLILAVGFGVEHLFYRFISSLINRKFNHIPTCIVSLFTQIFGRLLKDISGLAIFFASILLMYILFVPAPGVLHELILLFLPALLIIRLSYLVLIFIYSPNSPHMRMVPQDCLSSRLYFRGILVFIALTLILKRSLFLLQAHGLPQESFLICFSAIGILQFTLLFLMLYMDRTRITRFIMKKRFTPDSDARPDTGKIQFLWLTISVLTLGCFEILWQYNLVVHNKDLSLPLLLTLLSFPLGFLIFSIGYRLLLIASGRADLMDPRVLNKDILTPGKDLFKMLNLQPPEETIDTSESEKKISALEPFLPVLEKTMAVLIGCLLLFWIFRLWGIEVSLGLQIIESAASIFVTLLLGYIFWGVASAFIDMKIEDEKPEGEDGEADGEGSAGGSRKATILTLVRKFLFTGLVVIVILTVLHYLGINIGPLLAGAGIFGLAIGFGSQALVKDILSGLFFLVDDAFRVGDYIETSGVKGMVQQISLRSIKLRHPRGMLFTVPYGDMGAIQNFSRDYIITKLDIRVRYDANIDKIRKIVKKIYKEIQKDEEMSSVLLGKIKSQGVKKMDDSAMVLRVKFKTIPGGQFIVRRIVFQRIQEKFRENNIEFAHKNVTVYLPPGSENNSDALKAGAAAAAESQNTAPVPVKA